MTDKYTPTTEQVFEVALLGAMDAADHAGVRLEEQEFRAQLDRWLAAHEAAIRADERAKVLAEQGEPEWEYGLMQDDGYVENWGVSFDVDRELDAMRAIADVTGGRIVRRVFPGSWVRVEPVNESEKP